MKGLLLKDFYMTAAYCKSYLLIAAVFIVLSLSGNNNMFFVFYPVLLCGMIPVNLLGYDERSHWIQYSGTLPYTKAQIVSAKYLTGLFAQLAMLLVTEIAQAVRISINGSFQWEEFLTLMLTMLIFSTLTSAVSLPFVFKLGVERGRISYYFMIGILFAAGFAAAEIFKTDIPFTMDLKNFLTVFCLIGIAVYALSWYLSIVFYKKREL